MKAHVAKVHQEELLGESRGGIDEPALSGTVVHQGQAGHPLALEGIRVRFLTLGAVATGLGHAAVLGGEFDFALLRQALPMDKESLLAKLDALLKQVLAQAMKEASGWATTTVFCKAAISAHVQKSIGSGCWAC